MKDQDTSRMKAADSKKTSIENPLLFANIFTKLAL